MAAENRLQVALTVRVSEPPQYDAQGLTPGHSHTLRTGHNIWHTQVAVQVVEVFLCESELLSEHNRIDGGEVQQTGF